MHSTCINLILDFDSHNSVVTTMISSLWQKKKNLTPNFTAVVNLITYFTALDIHSIKKQTHTSTEVTFGFHTHDWFSGRSGLNVKLLWKDLPPSINLSHPYILVRAFIFQHLRKHLLFFAIYLPISWDNAEPNLNQALMQWAALNFKTVKWRLHSLNTPVFRLTFYQTK